MFSSVCPPDESVKRAALDRWDRLVKSPGALGDLEDVGTWIAACQAICPPRPLTRPRVVVFAGDHGVAARSISVYPAEATAQALIMFVTGGGAVNVLAAANGAALRIVDMAVAAETAVPDDVKKFKVRHGSGAVDQEDALTDDEVRLAVEAGRAIADQEVDAGADVLIAGDLGIGNSTVTAILVAALTGAEPNAVVGRGTGIDNETWIRKVAVVRDALCRAHAVSANPLALLRTSASADIAAMAAFLAQAAVRGIPVLLDGAITTAAALVAERLAPGARQWWLASHRSTEPSHQFALAHLGLKPLVDLKMRHGEGSGALIAFPLVAMATRVLAEMTTFKEAGITSHV